MKEDLLIFVCPFLDWTRLFVEPLFDFGLFAFQRRLEKT
jgi:hypothetical protein